MADWDTLFVDCHLATMRQGGEPAKPYGAIEDGAIAVSGDKIAWCGPRADLPKPPADCANDVRALDGAWVTPGLIDCHTHIVYGGDRAGEFELRLEGASYEEISRAGGGIRSTVEHTRAATEDVLVAAALGRIADLTAEGVTVIEIKSGYGLTREDEIKQLRAARRIAREAPVTVVTTFLGAHAVPPEFDGQADRYIDLVCDDMIPAVAAQGLADAVDVFCDGIGFSAAQSERVFQAARKHGLPVKGHVGQLSDLGGAELAARYEALSCDHLEFVSEAGVTAMADAGTVAVLLPGAFYFLRETHLPPLALFRAHGVPIAIATDCNPGSSPATSLLLMMNMGCTLFRLTPEEALAGVTREAARALGMQAAFGTLEAGKAADLAIWRIGQPAELSYKIGANPCEAVVKSGKLVRDLR
ncbi:MAG TPA: imidazolonepropionase [Alphaproteobacteria bacterium]|nr:imidazolonepropionase [Alphaproteobacteria bacterium]